MKISIKRASQVPIRDQLIEQIGLQIASGVLKGEEKLPSIRALAQRLGIHYNTISSAYNHLAEVGLLNIRQGSGVRVSGKIKYEEPEPAKSGLGTLLRDFLGIAAEHGYSRQDVQAALEKSLSGSKLARILVVDRNRDFHRLLVAELQPHFKLKVVPTTVEDLSSSREMLVDSLVVTSLYHLFSLQNLEIDRPRLVVCNVEPGRCELDVVESLPAQSLVVLVSISPTLLKMATNLLAALRGEEIAIRTIELADKAELQYSLPYANLVLCDRPSQDTVEGLCKRVPVRVFHLYSEDTIKLIAERLEKWG